MLWLIVAILVLATVGTLITIALVLALRAGVKLELPAELLGVIGFGMFLVAIALWIKALLVLIK